MSLRIHALTHWRFNGINDPNGLNEHNVLNEINQMNEINQKSVSFQLRPSGKPSHRIMITIRFRVRLKRESRRNQQNP